MTLHPSITDTRTINNFKTLEQEYHKIHNNKYDYTKTIYTRSTDKITITCPTHGDFTQLAADHKRGNGCSKCKGGVSITKDDFISNAKKVHGEKYDYSLVEYTNMMSPVNIICPIHGKFTQRANDHSNGGCGCSECKREKLAELNCNVYSDEPTLLYYVKITKDCMDYYKIGITTKSVEYRYSRDVFHGCMVEVIWEENFDNGYDAFYKEQRIIRENISKKYIGDPILFSGNSELFVEDIY